MALHTLAELFAQTSDSEISIYVDGEEYAIHTGNEFSDVLNFNGTEPKTVLLHVHGAKPGSALFKTKVRGLYALVHTYPGKEPEEALEEHENHLKFVARQREARSMFKFENIAHVSGR